MPSSTSNSNAMTRVPDQPMGKVYLLSILIVFSAFGTLEYLFRHSGRVPSLQDNTTLWAMQRDRLEASDTSRSVVILGTSRAQLGLDPEVMEKNWPCDNAVMLAIEGTQGYGVLRDIADNSDFRGLVVLACKATIDDSPRTAEHVGIYHEMYDGMGTTINKVFNQQIATFLSEHLVVTSPKARLDNMALSFLRGKSVIEPNFVPMQSSRYRPAYYRDAPSEWLKRCRQSLVDRLATTEPQEPLDMETWQKVVADAADAAAIIEKRGGKVVFLRMPTTDEYWQLDQKVAPRKQYWDAFRRAGLRTIHFKDYPQLSCFDCPDTSHLDHEDAVTFTKSLYPIMEAIGANVPGSKSQKEKTLISHTNQKGSKTGKPVAM